MPRDASTGEYHSDARLAADAKTDDQTDRDTATPIARDEPFWYADEREYTDDPDRAKIEEWVEEYESNPLIKRPIQLFTEDVFEPGYATSVHPQDPTADAESFDEPTVPEEYPNAQYHGLDLSAALDRWLARCGITADSFAKDLTTVLKQALRDAYGRRGTGLIEHSYADPRERKRLIGLRPFQVDDVTAYTRAGKAILLRPDDDADSLALDDSIGSGGGQRDRFGFKPRRAPTLGLRDRDRDDIPSTLAGKTAAFVQYDDIYGSDEFEEIGLALDDVTMFARDPDTGAVFGRPDSAPVVPRAKAIRTLYEDVDQGVKNAAWNSIVANVETDNKEEAKKMLSGLDPNNPESVSVTNTAPDIQVIDGQTPDVVELIQQQIEYVISALPVSLYRVGFEGDINRDVTGEQSDDYADALSSARQWVESQLRPALEQKACEFLTGHAHPEDADDGELYGDPSDVPDVSLHIEPDTETNPLRSEHFEADQFASMMQGLKAAAPGGQVSQFVRAEAIIALVPGWDADEVLPETVAAAAEMNDLPALDEDDAAVQEQFAETLGVETADLATQYSEGDEVDTPDGVGVVVEIRTEPFTGPGDDEVDASDDSPAYVVGVEDGAAVFRASDLSLLEDGIEVDGDVSPTDDLEAAAAAVDIADATDGTPPDTAALVDDGRRFDYPGSWDDSPTPNRIILLKAWAGLGGRFTSCRRKMAGEVSSPARFCASMKDRVLNWEGWRQ